MGFFCREQLTCVSGNSAEQHKCDLTASENGPRYRQQSSSSPQVVMVVGRELSNISVAAKLPNSIATEVRISPVVGAQHVVDVAA